MKTINEQISYLGKHRFVTFKNADQFPLSFSLRNFLKTRGVLSNGKSFPFLVCDGQLKTHASGSHLIVIGKGAMDQSFCIDTLNGERLVSILPDGSKYLINSSLQNYISCMYQLTWYYAEIEGEETMGDYDKNHKKYAAKLRSMLNEAEPGIKNFPTWEMTIVEKELGVM